MQDANFPRLVPSELPVFRDLLSDIFPFLTFNRVNNEQLENMIVQSALDLKLQPHDVFVARVMQLEELLQVRHSVFLLGKAGTGKTEVYRTLLRTYGLMGFTPMYSNLEPKVFACW